MISGGSAGLRTMIALPRPRAAHALEAARGRLRELVDVRARARARRLAGDARHDLGIRHRRDAGDRPPRSESSPARRTSPCSRSAGPRAREIDRRDEVRTDGGGREVDDLLGMAAEHRVVPGVRARPTSRRRRSAISSNAGHPDEPVDRRPRSPARPSAAPARGRPTAGSMPDERGQFERARRPNYLDHQIGADVAAPDDRDLDAHARVPSVEASIVADLIPVRLKPVAIPQVLVARVRLATRNGVNTSVNTLGAHRGMPAPAYPLKCQHFSAARRRQRGLCYTPPRLTAHAAPLPPKPRRPGPNRAAENPAT